MPNVKPIPDGYHTVTPYLTVSGADKVMDFLKRAFDGKEVYALRGPDGRIAHAEIQIGDSRVMLGEARGEWTPTVSTQYLYVQDADSLYRRALEAGATSVQEMKDQFYGDRSGGVKDPAGNMWWIATHIEDVTPQEIDRRAAQMFAGQQTQSAAS